MSVQFWKWLEKRPGQTAVIAQWRSVAGEWLPAISSLLVPLDRRATIYPNLRPYGQPMKVVVHADGQVVAIDESDWEHRIVLEPHEIVLHRLDLRRLRTALSNALDGLRIAKTPVDQNATCLRVGNWEPKKAASFPVYLLLCQNINMLRLQVAQLAGKRSAAILLTPSRTNWDDALVSSLKTSNILLVPLSEIVAPNDNAFQETPAWEEYLRAFCQMVELTLPGNYQIEKPIPMRGMRAANIERLEKELEEHLLAARDYAYTRQQRGQEPELLPRPDQKDLAKRLGVDKSAVSRCLRDPRAKVLKILWHTADSLEDVMRYRRC